MQWTGSAWQKITLQSDNVLDIVSTFAGTVETIHVTNGLRVARTSQTGVPTAWTYSAAIPPYSSSQPGYINRLAVRVVGGQTQILATQQKDWGGRVFYSSDGGSSWTNIGNNNFVNDLTVNPTRAWKPGGKALFLSAAFDPFNASTYVITDDWGIWKSTNAGGSWRESVSGTPNVIGTDLIRDPRTGTYLVGAMDNGLTEYNPSTGAVTAVFPKAGTNPLYNGHVWRVIVLPNGNRVVSIAPWNDVKNSIVIIRPDGTTAFATGLPASYPRTNTVWQQGYGRGLVVDPKNPNRLYLTIDGDGAGLFISNDGGFSWSRSPGQPGNLRAYRLTIDPVDTQRLYYGTMWAGSAGGFWRSWDGGKTWARSFSSSGNIGDIVVAPDRTVYLGTENAGAPALYVSKDRGVTFTLLKRFDVVGATPGPIQAITLDPNNPKRFAVSSRKWGDNTGAQVYLTTDGGTTWSNLSAGLPNTSGAAKMMFSQDGTSLYLVMNAGSLFQIPL
jgi:photosystem II stability/assembly factor-like uncharacterized protein